VSLLFRLAVMLIVLFPIAVVVVGQKHTNARDTLRAVAANEVSTGRFDALLQMPDRQAPLLGTVVGQLAQAVEHVAHEDLIGRVHCFLTRPASTRTSRE
jgi:hypothetical protein